MPDAGVFDRRERRREAELHDGGMGWDRQQHPPAMVSVATRPARYTLKGIQQTSTFSVNIITRMFPGRASTSLVS